MAKASPIDGVDAHTPLDKAIQRILMARLADVRAWEPALRGNGATRTADAVHDMRVATRRLRAALTLFAKALDLDFDEEQMEIKRLGAALGRVRDLDVQIQRLEEALGDETDLSQQVGITKMVDQRRARVAEPVTDCENRSGGE
jgi:CHAD domain-containing protein